MSKQDRHSPTTHRVRAGAFQQRTSHPRRELYPPDLADCYTAARKGGPEWQEVGPMNSGGRLTSMVIDPHNPDRIFVGAAGGGVWTSELGRHWTSVWSDQSRTLNIGALAIHNTSPKSPPPEGEPGFILYAGTGEANMSGDNYPGVGLFRNVDGGKTKVWPRAGDTEHPIAPEAAGAALFVVRGLPRRIGCVAVDPFAPDHILLGGVTHNGDEMAALFETRDAGKTWGLAIDRNPVNEAASLSAFSSPQGAGFFITRLSYFCHAVLFHPQRQDLVFAAVETRGSQSGIWISTDGAQSWTHARNGLPPGDQFGRTSIAFAGDGKTVYALVGQQGTQELVGVFRSDDLGAHWTACGKGGFQDDGQLSYTNCIAAHPEDPGTVVVGSLDLHKSTNGGKTWKRISSGRLYDGRPGYVHHDQHAIVLTGDRIYSANDGGFALSEDGGKTWTTRNAGLAVCMFYDLDISQKNSECLGGGTQDLGTWFRGPLLQSAPAETPASAVIREFRDELFGDGGWTCYDPDDDCHVFACSQRMQLWRHTRQEGWTQVDLGSAAPREERRQVWMAAVAMDCSSNRKSRGPRAVYIGSHRLWRSLDDGETWTPFEEEFDRSVITAIEVAPADPNVIYVGTSNGGIFRSTDAGKHWSRNLAGPIGPGRLITRIETRAGDAGEVRYTVGLVAESYDPADPNSRPSPRLQHSGLPRTRNGRQEIVEFFHLYTSRDGGETWSFIEAQSLPNLPHNAVVALPEKATAVAHDGGVELDLGEGFVDITGTLPNTRITDLVYHEHDGDLYASTYGRGIWRVSRDEVFRWSRGRPAARADQKPTDSGGTKSSTDRPTAVPLEQK